jgi:hypothetical protein
MTWAKRVDWDGSIWLVDATAKLHAGETDYSWLANGPNGVVERDDAKPDGWRLRLGKCGAFVHGPHYPEDGQGD